MSFSDHKAISSMPGAPVTTCGTLIVLFKLWKNVMKFNMKISDNSMKTAKMACVYVAVCN